MAKRKKAYVHRSIKISLGYDEGDSDESVFSDWKQRLSRVCKPCWELKYCPYGPLVEQSPTLPTERSAEADHMAYFRHCVETGLVGSVETLDDESISRYKLLMKDDDILLSQAITNIRNRKMMEVASEESDDEARIEAWIGRSLPPIHVYRVSFDEIDNNYSLSEFSGKLKDEIETEICSIKSRYKQAIESGIMDSRHPIEPPRLAWFKSVLGRYNPDNHPEIIPEIFQSAVCNIFGHVCPVFFAAEALTESSEGRRIGRQSIPFAMRMRIVRRDNYTCQECSRHLRDDEVEFDHIIPVSKGGSSEEHNIRLTCFDCNRGKSDEYSP